MLAQAVKSNPELRLAEAKLREAEAELNHTRHRVVHRVTTLYYDIDTARKALAEAEQRYATVAKLGKQGATSQEDVQAAQFLVARSRAELAKLEAEVPFLLGKHQQPVSQAAFSPDGRWLAASSDGQVRMWNLQPSHFWSANDVIWTADDAQVQAWDVQTAPWKARFFVNAVQGTVLERLRKALDTPVSAAYQNKSFHDILDDLKKKAPGLSFQIPFDLKSMARPLSIHVDGEVPIKAVLQLLGDTLNQGNERIGFAIRDYGILVVLESQMPPGALRLDDIDKIGAEKTKDKKPAAPTPDAAKEKPAP
jgi:hypothetical protein